MVPLPFRITLNIVSNYEFSGIGRRAAGALIWADGNVLHLIHIALRELSTRDHAQSVSPRIEPHNRNQGTWHYQRDPVSDSNQRRPKRLLLGDHFMDILLHFQQGEIIARHTGVLSNSQMRWN